MRKKVHLKIFTFFLSFFIAIFITLPAYAATIVLDPGHSSISKGLYDDPYNIYDDDYPNKPEITEVMDVANWLNQKLTADGYHVIMTKSAWNNPSFVSLYQRAQIANNAHADLAISIHDDHSQNWSNFAQVYDQQTNEYRINKNGSKVTFAQVAGSNANTIASKSQQYAQIMANERSKVEGHTVSVTQANFAGRAPLAAGNIPQVQLYAKVPWVYNEVGGIGINLSEYEQGILNGIEKAIPPSGGSNGSGSNTASSCFIINQNNLPKNASLPAACNNGNESAIVQKVIALARTRINNKNITYYSGQPSRNWATENPNTNDPTLFDCSGFVGWAWYWGSGGKVNMGGQTNYDWNNSGNRPYYQKVVTSDESQLKPGDAIYINNGLNGAQPGHVGLYIGKDPGSTCSANDCFMQFYSTGQPGDEESLKADGGSSILMGYIRMKLQ